MGGMTGVGAKGRRRSRTGRGRNHAVILAACVALLPSPAAAAALGIKCDWSLTKGSSTASIWDNFWVDLDRGTVFSNRLKKNVSVNTLLPGLLEIRLSYEDLTSGYYSSGTYYPTAVGPVEFDVVIDRISAVARPSIVSGAKGFTPVAGKCEHAKFF